MMGNPKNKRDSELYQFNTGSRTSDEEQQHSGETTRVSGIYRVMRHAHFPEKEFFMRKNKTLPSCPICGQQIEFRLQKNIVHITEDPDFQ